MGDLSFKLKTVKINRRVGKLGKGERERENSIIVLYNTFSIRVMLLHVRCSSVKLSITWGNGTSALTQTPRQRGT